MKMFFPAILSLCFLSACQTDYNMSSKHPIEYDHDYDGHSHDHSTADHSHGPTVGGDVAKNIYGDKNRNAWQKTEIIRYHLGESEGKVLADIGAGPYGYFTFDFAHNANFKKILALDIDQDALKFINNEKTKLKKSSAETIETRLVGTNDPKIKENEADVVLIANTLIYIENRLEYLSNLKKAIKKGGRLVIVDYKMKELPEFFPPREERMGLYQMEELIKNAGFEKLISDDFSLPYQYVLVCINK